MSLATKRHQVPKDLLGWSYDSSRTSSVTTSWGVKWDEEAVARDLMQNFYDSNRADLDKVVVKVWKGGLVTVDAPVEFSLERLFYLGSEKDKNVDAGQFGEGFKAAALILIRDHKIEPVVISGQRAARIRASDEVVGDTKLVPIVYDFYDATQDNFPSKGTQLRLNGCSAKLATAMLEGLTHFWHEKNPLVGKKLWANKNDDVSLYEAADGKNGAIFYRRQKRGVIPSIPVVIVIDKPNKAIEKKTQQDRDRLAFGSDLVTAAYRAFATSIALWENTPVFEIVRRSASVWREGHPLLAAVSDRGNREYWVDKAASIFGNPKNYYAAVNRKQVSLEVFLSATEIEGEWRKAGRIELPSYFSMFGIENSLSERRRREEVDLSRKQRKPTEGEAAALAVLLKATKELAPEVKAIFKEDQTSYAIALSEDLLGEFRHGRHQGSTTIFLSGGLFLGDFAEAIATYLHEHAHVFGYDASRAFTDALTTMIASCIRLRGKLDEYEDAWSMARAKVELERENGVAQAVESLDDAIAAMNEDELRGLLGRIPDGVVKAAIRNKTKKSGR